MGVTARNAAGHEPKHKAHRSVASGWCSQFIPGKTMVPRFGVSTFLRRGC